MSATGAARPRAWSRSPSSACRASSSRRSSGPSRGPAARRDAPRHAPGPGDEARRPQAGAGRADRVADPARRSRAVGLPRRDPARARSACGSCRPCGSPGSSSVVTLALEARIHRAPERACQRGPDLAPGRRSCSSRSSAFTGVAALVPGGLVQRRGMAARCPLSETCLLVLAAGDALVAFLLGYRAAALRSSTLRDAPVFGRSPTRSSIAIAAAALRAIEIPRLLGPALLVLVFYLWDAFHGAAPARRRDRAGSGRRAARRPRRRRRRLEPPAAA